MIFRATPDDLKSLTGMGGFEKDNVLLSPQAEIASSTEVQVNGCPAYEIVYLQGFPSSADKSKILETFFVDCNKEYVLRYSGTVDLKYSGENAFEKIIYWTEKGNKLRNLSRLSL